MANHGRKPKNVEGDQAGLGWTHDFLGSWREARPDLDLGQFLQAIAITRIGRIIDLSFDRMCRAEHGISGADMRVLFALRRAGPPFQRRPTDLFRAILVTSGTMTKQIDRLAARGFVTRSPDANHGGGFLIGLTEEGQQTVNAATDRLATRSILRFATVNMSPSQRAAGEKYVFALLDALEEAGRFDGNLPSR